MNTIFSLLVLLALHSHIMLIRAEKSKYPLVFNFNPITSTVYIDENRNSEKSQSVPYPVVAACPAETDEEKNMNQDQSMDHKALFIRKYYDSNNIKPDDEIRCEENFELSVVLSTKNHNIQFGYEIYYENSVFPKYVKNVPTYRYTLCSSVGDLFTRSRSNTPYASIPRLSETKPLEFFWLNKFLLKFDAERWEVLRVSYNLYRSAVNFNVKCHDNHLGKQVYVGGEVDLDLQYTEANKNNILDKVKLPKKSTCLFTENICLKKYNLVMPHHFQSSPSSNVSCSDLTTVTIWYEVNEKLLDYSEKFLTAISEITRRELTVISGGYQILSLPFRDGTSLWRKMVSKKIYLNGVDKLPVPRIIFKIVMYHSHACDNEVDLCVFEMVIVIHNEPKITKKLCKKDKCSEWGWDSIQYLRTTDKKKGKKSEFIYCCELSADLRERLYSEVQRHKRNDLNLKNFPYDYDEVENKIKYKDMQNDFEGKMKELFEQD